jgi:hypothetical protein
MSLFRDCEHRTQSKQTCASRGFANFVEIPRDQKRLMLGQKLQQLAMFPAIRRALLGDKYDLDQRRGAA